MPQGGDTRNGSAKGGDAKGGSAKQGGSGKRPESRKTGLDYQGMLAANTRRLTPQRRAVLQVFLDNPEQHLNAEEIYRLVRKTHPDLGLATVYRTLELLADTGIVYGMDFGDGSIRYELCSAERHHHHHLVCTRCGRVTEVGHDLLDRLEEEIRAEYHFHITNHQLMFYGLCRQCQEAEARERAGEQAQAEAAKQDGAGKA